MSFNDGQKMCTTNGKPVDEVRAAQTNETGQHEGYIVLCPDERAKGFVRPYRDAYKHVGLKVCGKSGALSSNPDRHFVCTDAPEHQGDCTIYREIKAGFELERAQKQHQIGGCGSVTTMGRALSETYARDPKFYGSTFCVGCNKHYPVAEFTWTADGAQVGS